MVMLQLPGSKWFDTQMAVHTATQNTDVSLALESQKHLSNASRKHYNFDNGKHKKRSRKKSDKQRVLFAT